MMWKNYLQVGLRTLRRQRVHTLINVIGLATGITVCLLIFNYLHHEWSWNRQLADSERVYRVIEKLTPESGDPIMRTIVSSLLRPQVDEGVPGVQQTVRVTDSPVTLHLEDRDFEMDAMMMDTTALDFFGLRLIEGDQQTALADIRSVVLTTSAAERLFGDESPMGKTIDIEFNTQSNAYLVTGIIDDPEPNTSLQYEVLMSYEVPYLMFRTSFGDHWRMAFGQTFLKLDKETDPPTVEAKIADILTAIGEDQSTMAGARQYLLQPLNDVHMAFSNPRDLPTEETPQGSLVLLVIGLVILTIACINFTTLMIGQSTSRAHEVGVRKVLGSGRSSLMVQFWTETGLLTATALVIGIVAAELLLPLFNDFTQRRIDLQFDLPTVLAIAGLWVVVVFLAGSYPALVVSRFRPSQALRGEVKLGGKNRLRHTLVFIQFALSIALISSTLLMGSQLRYVLNRDLGFDESQVINVDVPSLGADGSQATEQMKLALADNPDVLEVAGTACNFTWSWMVMNWLDGPKEYKDVYVNVVDANYATLMGIDVVEGRDFIAGSPADSMGLMVNQALVNYMGWDNPIGEKLPGPGWPDHHVVGVMKDFHFSSMHDEIRPLVIMVNPMAVLQRQGGLDIQLNQWYTIQNVLIRLAPGDMQQTLREVEAVWTEILPDKPFDYAFVDETINERYANDRRWISIVTAASSLAIVIALLGLVGLTGLEVVRRTREIGIRKVLGASSRGIILLLTKPMLRLVLLANLIAWPVAWKAVSMWNENYAYSAPIQFWPLLIAGLATFVIAFGVAALLALRAANTNPAEVLQAE